MPHPVPAWVHAHRTARRHRDHRHPDGSAPAGGAEGAIGRGRRPCANNLKQIGLALHNYEGVNKTFPPSCVINNPAADGTAYGISYPDDIRIGPPGFAWGTLLLPYLEQNAALRPVQPERAVLVAGQRDGGRRPRCAVFLCPAATGGERRVQHPATRRLTRTAST